MSSQTLNKTPQWEAPNSIWNPMFLSIFFANMSLNMGQQMSNSLLSLYAKSMGSPANQIGQLMSMFAVTALIFRFISGPALNSFNRKKLLAMAMSFMATAYVGFSFAQPIADVLGLQAITVLKIFRLIQGIGNAFANSSCLTIVADVLPKDKFSTGMGYYSCAQVISQSIGPTVGIFLRDTFGYETTYLIVFAVMCCAILVSTRIKLAPRKSIPFSLKLNNVIAKEALTPATITFFVNMGFTSISAFLLIYSEEHGIVGGSLFFTVYALTLLLTRPMIGRLTERLGFAVIGIPAVCMTACSFVLIAYSGNLITLLIAAFVNAFGYGAIQPMLQSLCMKSVPPERRGSASGTNYIGTDLATIIGPMVCGEVSAMVGYVPTMWLVMTVPLFVGIAVIFLSRKRIKKIEQAFLSRSESK